MLEKTKQRLQDAVQPSKEHITDLKQDLNERFTAFKAGRSNEDQAKMQEDFANVLTAWGIEENQVPAAIRALKIRLVVFCIPPLLAVFMATQFKAGLIMLAGSICCLAVGVVGWATTIWRLYVLTFQEFVPFRKWLVSFLLKKGS